MSVTASGTGWGPKLPRGRGAPTKLTQKVSDTIFLALRTWHHFETACAIAGVGKTSAYAWLRDGTALADRIEAGELRMSALRAEDRRKVEFANGVKRSIAQSEAQGVDWVARAAGLPSEEVRTKEKVAGVDAEGQPIYATETTTIRRPPSWQPAAWLLEHRFADRWATRREVSGPGGAPVAVEQTVELGEAAKAALYAKVEAMAANLAELPPAPDAIDAASTEAPLPEVEEA